MFVAVVTAFAAGALALLSPCTAPILPGVFAAIMGGQAPGLAWWYRLGQLVAFSVGAAVVLVGSVAVVFVTAVPVDLARQPYSSIAGVVLILLGLSNLGIVKVSWLRPSGRTSPGRAVSIVRPFVLGITCAAVWYPCLGPSLALTYALAGEVRGVPVALLLALSYFLGLLAPLAVVGALIRRIPRAGRRVKRVGVAANFVVSVLLMVMGVLLITGLWLHISTWLTTVFGQFLTL